MASKIFWEQVLRLLRLKYLAFGTVQCYLAYSWWWHAVATAHPSLWEVRVSHNRAIIAPNEIYEAVFKPLTTLPWIVSYNGIVFKDVPLADLYYAGRNVCHTLEDNTSIHFVIDMVHRREFENFFFPRHTDIAANSQASLTLIDKHFSGWLD